MNTWEQEVKLDGILSGFQSEDEEWWGPIKGLFFRMDCILLRYSDEGSSGLSRNSSGNTNEEPKRASEAEMAESSLGTLRRPSRTRGRWWNQSDPAKRERRETLSWRWNLSTIPLDWACNEVVGEWTISRNLHRADHTELVKWAPRSDVITAGTPNIGIHERKSTFAHSSAVVECRGTASGHLVGL